MNHLNAQDFFQVGQTVTTSAGRVFEVIKVNKRSIIVDSAFVGEIKFDNQISDGTNWCYQNTNNPHEKVAICSI